MLRSVYNKSYKTDRSNMENNSSGCHRQQMSIKRGQRILEEKPFAYALKSEYRKDRCDNCLVNCKLRKCSNCNYVYYCGRQCQLQSWPMHKIECKFLKRVYPRIVPDAARMLCRLIIKLDNGGELERGYYTEKNSRKFRDLMSHYAEIKNDAKRLEHLESLHTVLSEMMHDNYIVPNHTELLSIYGRLITNGFNILDGEMNPIATAIYLGVSVTDHCCKPNAVATFEGTTLHVHATEHMTCLDWSKIHISYIDLLNTTQQRRAELKSNYFFLCSCSKCLNDQETLEMGAAACPNSNCKAFVDINLGNCECCNECIKPNYRKNFYEVMAFTKNHLENMKEVAYLDICKVCLTRQYKLLHPLNLWHVKTLDAAFESALAMSKWAEALDYGLQLLPGFRKYYGYWNPLLGLLYMKVAKLQLLELGRAKEALKNLQEALKILEVTHGREHSLLNEQLQPLMQQSAAECL